MACGEHHGHPLSLFLRLLKSPLPSRDNQVCWHTETKHDCLHLCHPETIKSDGMRRPSWSSVFIIFKTILVSFAIQRQESPLACIDHHGHPLFCCFQDYCSLLCHPETSESDCMRRPSWLSTFVVFKTIAVSFAFQRQASLLACKDDYGHFKF